MTDPISAGVISGVLATTIVESTKQAASAIKRYYSDLDRLTIPERVDIARIAHVVDRAVENDRELAAVAVGYTKSPEFVTFLEHVLAFKLSGRPIIAGGPLSKELQIGAKLHGVSDHEFLHSLLSVATGVADSLLKAADVNAMSTSLDAASRSRAGSLIAESMLASIDDNVRILVQSQSLNIDTMDDVLQSYMKSVGGVLGRIQPPNFDESKNVPLDSIYVTPSLAIIDAQDGTSADISIDHMLQLPRTVVLGDPGGGKTTLTKRIASSLSSYSHRIMRGDKPIVPFVITLRDYGPELAGHSMTIAEFITRSARPTFQVQLPLDAIEWTLSTGRAYVIFDGLDELLKASSRQKISDAITAFAIQYPNVGILVTSRRVGYVQAPLPEEIFQVVSLGELATNQVKRYVKNWFQLDKALSEEERLRLEVAFLKESSTVEDLRSNPLMLALMCTIYRAEGYIPRNRPDMYEKCSRMLFDRWDRHRGLLDSFEFQAHVEPALMSIAYSIFCNEEHQSGVPEAYLIGLASDYLQIWWYPDGVMARNAAQMFIEFCRGRAWVFTDVGLDEAENSLFQFTHRTFLEYFAAAHLARTGSTVEELCARLVPRVERGEWDIVAQLAIQIKVKYLQGGGDIAINLLLRHAEKSDNVDVKSNITLFVIRCLTFIIISPKAIRGLSDSLVSLCVHLAMNGDGINAREALRATNGSTRETQKSITCGICDALSNKLKRSPKDELPFVAGLAWSYKSFRNVTHRVRFSEESKKCLNSLQSNLDQVLAENLTWAWASVARYYGGKLAWRDLIDRVGIHLFNHSYEVDGVKVYQHSVVVNALSHAIRGTCDDRFCDSSFSMLKLLRDLLLANISQVDIDYDCYHPQEFVLSERGGNRHRRISDEELVAAAILMAWYLETSSDPLEVLKLVGRSRLRPLCRVLASRYRKVENLADVSKFANIAGWPTLVEWSEGRVSFLAQRLDLNRIRKEWE